MRLTTIWSIVCAVAWVFLNIIARAQAPGSLDDRDFGEKVAIASNLQGFGTIFLIAAIILILVTAYKNLFAKEAVRVEGDWNQADHGGVIASRIGGNVILRTEYNTASYQNLKLSPDQTDSCRFIKDFLSKSPSEEAKRAGDMLSNFEGELQKGSDGDKDKALGYLSRALTIAEQVAPAVGPIVDAIQKLKVLL